MRLVVIALAAAVVGLIYVGCGGGEDAQNEARLAQMSAKERYVQDVLTRRCVRCHRTPEDEGKVVLTEPSHLLARINVSHVFDDIALYNAIMGGPNVPAHDRAEFRPTQTEINAIREWILERNPDWMNQQPPADSTGTAPSA